MLLVPLITLLAICQTGPTAQDERHPAAWDLTVEDMAAPNAVAMLPDGRVLVTEPHAHRIAVLNSNGSRMTSWGKHGSHWDEMHRPAGIDSDGDGTVVVADTGNHRVKLLDESGLTVGVVTEVDGSSFRSPQDVAISDNWIAIADTGNDRVCVLNRNETRSWCVDASLSLHGPQAVDVDQDGALCVADTGNHRILVFNPDGSLRATFGDWGRFPGLFAEPSGIEFHGELVYVADRLNHRVQVFTRDGEPVTWWGMHAVKLRQGEGHIHYPSDIAISEDGQRAVVSEPLERRVQFFKPGPPSRPSPSKTRAPRGLQSHFGPELETGGRGLVVWEPEVRSLAVFITDRDVPIHVTTFGTPGDGPGRIGDIADLIWDDASGVLTIIDSGNDTIHRWRITLPPLDALRYDPNAAVLLDSRSMNSVHSQTSTVQLDSGRFVIIDENGVIHLKDPSWNDEIYLRDYRLPSIDPVAIGTDGTTIAIADGRTGRIHLFDQDLNAGNIIGPAPGLEHPWPGGVAILEDGSVVVSDTAADRIDHFAASGTHLATYSGPGVDHGQIWMPGEIAQDAMGRIVVLDHGNHRMQAFEPGTGWVLTFGLGRSMTPDRLKRSTQP
ncbi:MAG: NHL repeat-containing protein [Planctomycetota bacterium]|nr:NHL repeat-containing protein [Planctomycetota bacterium]